MRSILDDLYKSKVDLIKLDGQKFKNILVNFKNKEIIMDDISLPVEEGDQIRRVLPNKLEEKYIIKDRGFNQETDEFSAYYRISVERITSEKDNNASKYRASKLLLEYVYNEINRENERLKLLESRIPILITISTFFGGLILSNTGINFSSMLSNNDSKIFIFIGLQTISYIALTIAIFIFTGLLLSVKYKRLEITGFTDIQAQASNEYLVAYDIMSGYMKTYNHNQTINSKKMLFYNIGVVSLAISILSYLILKVVNLF